MSGQSRSRSELRERAGRIVAEVADRLADPARVTSIAAAAGNVDRYPGRKPDSPWVPMTLSAGHAGLALLFAELAYDDCSYRDAARAHLAAAARAAGDRQFGLYGGVAGVGVAAQATAAGGGDYPEMLRQVDDYVHKEALGIAAIENQRMDAGVAGVANSAYDLISGLAGLGVYLLERPVGQPLESVLSCLVRLTEAVPLNGTAVPGWWSPGRPFGTPARPERYRDGHFNVGLAHGIPGPLALLSLARLSGVEVNGQEQAIARIGSWLDSQRLPGVHGDYWPCDAALPATAASAAEDPGDRAAWCYGTPGVARALYLAACAVGRPDWKGSACNAMAGSLWYAQDTATSRDVALCHGLSGLLYLAQAMVRDGTELDAAMPDRLAGLVVDRYDPTAPFGFRYSSATVAVAPDRPGFLEGAAGVLLALHAYSTDRPPRTGWDRTLLIG